MTEAHACPVCGAAFLPHVNFCGSCGTKLANPCPRCGTRNPTFFRFCSSCGLGLGSQETARRAAERRQVTILFADVKGFVSVTAGRDPEAIADLMNRYFGRLSDEISRYGGTIDKYIGDAVMAIFGAPNAHENDPERAVLAALGMQRSIGEFSQTGLKGVPLKIRIGIASGEVLFGLVGSTAKRDYTVMGDAVNLASRLEGIAPVGGIVISEATQHQVARLFDLEAIPKLSIDGLDAPITAYQVIGPARQRGRIRGVDGESAGLVGRRDELDTLVQAFEKAAAGAPVIVDIVGEAGIGKSRLVDELARRVGDKARLVRGHSLPYEEASAFGLARDLVLSLLGGREGGGTRSEILKALGTSVPKGEHRTVLARILGVDADARGSFIPDEVGQQSAQAAAELLRGITRERPLVVVLEDLHWADAASLNLLRSVIGHSPPNSPVLYVLVSRPDFTLPAEWKSFPRTRVELQPLSTSESGELLRGLTGTATLPDDLAATLLHRAQGNPFFLEELVRALADRGAIERAGNGWRFIKAIDLDAVPVSLRAVLLTRIDKLADGARQAIQTASVIGNGFNRQLLGRVLGQSFPTADSLTQLVAVDLVRADPAHPGTYRFRHNLAQEVSYQTIALAQRKQIHRQVAAALEAAGDEVDPLDDLVYHYYRGDQWEKVAVLARRAADRARHLYANREAIALYGRAIEALDQLERGTPTGGGPATLPVMSGSQIAQDRAAVHVDRADVQATIGDFNAALDGYRLALLAEKDRERRAGIQRRIGEVHERLGEFGQALRHLSLASDELGPAGISSAEMARILASMSLVYYQQGETRQATDAYERSLAIGGGHRDVSRAIIDLRNDTPSAPLRWQEELGTAQTALKRAERSDDRRQQARAHARLGSLFARRRDTTQAMSHLTRGVQLLEALGDQNAAAGTLVNLGIVQEAAGQTEAAIASYLRACGATERTGDARGHARALARLGVAECAVGRQAEAIRHLERAINAVTQISAREHFPEYYRQFAEVLLACGSSGRAIETAQTALQWATQIGARFEEAAARRVLGRAALQGGRFAEANNQLKQSLALFERIGATTDAASVRDQIDAMTRTL